MKTVGIIAEFNPFHNGHRYLIEQAKKKTGADCCVVIMSGDFVQRGAPAVCNKYLRSEMALKNGADIVFELPTVFSLGSAEMFADGAVSLLCSTGLIDYLCFGSECGDAEALIKCASRIEESTASGSFKEDLSSFIKNGLSYPSAFSKALSNNLGAMQSILLSPNNLLGIEYIRSLIRIKNTHKKDVYQNEFQDTDPSSEFHLPEVISIKRIGSEHFDKRISDFSSASSIRNSLEHNDDLSKIFGSVPKITYEILSSNYNRLLPVTEEDFSSMLYMRLNTVSDEDLFAISDINKDLSHKLLSYKGKPIFIPELIMNLKSKCFTYTAISRALFRLILSPLYINALEKLKSSVIFRSQCKQNSDIDSLIKDKQYLRVLGFRKDKSEFLRLLRYSESINVITKPVDGPLTNPCYALDIYASNLYEQVVYNKFKTGFTEELKTGPVII